MIGSVSNQSLADEVSLAPQEITRLLILISKLFARGLSYLSKEDKVIMRRESNL